MPPKRLYDLSQIDFDNVVYGVDEINEINPQREAMQQLTAVVHVDREQDGIVGFKDVTEDEFWVSGHMPDFPIMPGVIICECLAQLAGFYAKKFDVLGGDYVGFGGMDKVRFRAPVFPNSRLVLACKMKSVRTNRRSEFEFQAFVDDTMVASGEMIGVAITRNPDSDESR